MTKRMTFLNCRRNSAQLKVDQYSRTLASTKPRIRVRRDSDKKRAQQPPLSEEKLKEMNNKLITINEEIQEQRMKNKVCNDREFD